MSAYNLAGVLVHHADRFPVRPCLVWGQETITYGALDRQAARTAAGLQRLGIGRGDVVALPPLATWVRRRQKTVISK